MRNFPRRFPMSAYPVLSHRKSFICAALCLLLCTLTLTSDCCHSRSYYLSDLSLQIPFAASKFHALPDIRVPLSESPDTDTGAAAAEALIPAVLNSLNKQREHASLPILALSDTLSGAAAIRAGELPVNFSHYRPDDSLCFSVLDSCGMSYTYAGENLLSGTASVSDLTIVYDASWAVQQWMDSPSHKENILNEHFLQVGIGYYIEEQTIYYVTLFTD